MSGYRVLSVEDIRAFPPTIWLASGLIPLGSLGVLYGSPGIGKSFIALDLAHSVGTGERFLGRRVRQANVVYTAAGEGVSGLHQRIDAWEIARGGVAIENVGYVTDAVQLHIESHVAKFIKTIRPLDPSLVVFDTLARCFVGGDENSVEDMGKVIGAADEIRAQTGATVLFVHHSGRPDQEGNAHERGSSALPAAADFMIHMTGPEDALHRVLRCPKQKDSERFGPIHVELTKVRQKGRTLSLVPTVC